MRGVRTRDGRLRLEVERRGGRLDPGLGVVGLEGGGVDGGLGQGTGEVGALRLAQSSFLIWQ